MLLPFRGIAMAFASAVERGIAGRGGQSRTRDQRQIFDAFDLPITYGNVDRRIEISPTVSEAIAEAFET